MIAAAAAKPQHRSHATPQSATVFPTELGWMGIAWRGDMLTRVTFGHECAVAAQSALPAEAMFPSDRQLTTAIRQTIERLTRFAAGDVDDLTDIAIHLEHLTRFQRAVVDACRAIGRGEVKTYADLAALVGSPRAARAVGNVMRSNRYPLIVPCHRVVGPGGRLCGFTSPQGLAMKERLLRREGVVLR
jgi:methylated-DNA-[protein]-cysteine S-methyltransferase